MTNAQLLFLFKQAVKRLAAAKKTETELRIAVAARFFPNARVGTTWAMNNQLKLERKLNYKIDATQDEIIEFTDKLAVQFPGVEVSDLVRWNPSVNGTAYRQLPAHVKNEFDKILIISDAKPVVKLADEDDE